MTANAAARYLALGALAVLVVVPIARGDNVPFAQPRLSGSPVALSDIMAGVQLRHIKLGEAIKTRDFPLARFEAELLAESLANAAMLYSNIPIDYVTAATTPLVGLKDAAIAKDAAKLGGLFAQLTSSCSACHVAAAIPFVQIKTPTFSPFTDQHFAPDDK